ncbi:uncharacterized protein RCC_04777 [Ramularia collo-cygni]|uniref:Uncharacterized protein n=1 Tax=Ramularia collo-cygni TaxID=112498 RepID=A0A2D3UQ73_9PEZI|nr:uncharacterized protein RCC_04777 [Ramularia collo-cygni]CZT18932.1 uncharacterized protein RCC_04777 [Ramularia collo-cygni]
MELPKEFDHLDAPRDLWDPLETQALAELAKKTHEEYKSAKEVNENCADNRIWADDVSGVMAMSDELKTKIRTLIKTIIKRNALKAADEKAIVDAKEAAEDAKRRVEWCAGMPAMRPPVSSLSQRAVSRQKLSEIEL